MSRGEREKKEEVLDRQESFITLNDEYPEELQTRNGLTSDSQVSLLIPSEIEQRQRQYDDRKPTIEHMRDPMWWRATIWRQKGTIIYLTVVFIALLLIGLLVDGWHHFTWQAWYSIAVTMLTFLLLVRDDWDPSLSMMLSLTLLLAAQGITGKQALAGFSNSGVFTIAVLFVTARAVADCGILQIAVRRFFPKTGNLMLATTYLFLPTSLLF